MQVAVLGLGKLGVPLLSVIASAGHDVIGYDIDLRPIEALNAGRSPIDEPGVQKLIDANRERIRATPDLGTAVKNADITFIIVPTPSNAEGRFELRYVMDAAVRAAPHLSGDNGNQVLAIMSTVMPGDTALVEQRLREDEATCGVCYNPTFIALGNVVRGLLYPDYILIGESDDHSGVALEQFWRTVVVGRETCPIVKRMSFVNAELTKIGTNCALTNKTNFGHMITDICEHIEGADASIVLDAIGSDHRIGKALLQPGASYGGPCLPRDSRALAYAARSVGTDAALAIAGDTINENVVGRVESMTLSVHPKTIAVLGLTYKTGTSVTEESMGVKLIQRLVVSTGGFARILAIDPAAPLDMTGELPVGVERTDDFSRIMEAEAVVICTPWPQFSELSPAWIKEGAIVIDCWRQLSQETFHCWRKMDERGESYATVVHLGKGQRNE